jgi:hypothetical protein
MTHIRYWAMTLAVAAGGGFLAVNKFAFTPTRAVWIAFGVAIAAGVFSLAAAGVALARQNHGFSGLSAISALIAGFTIIATRAFAAPTALWLAFAGGIALLLVSLRALALHETTVERVVHQLELSGTGRPVAVRQSAPLTASSLGRLRDGLQISEQMRSWVDWLTLTALGLAGGFAVLTTFAWANPPAAVEPRWVWFGIGVAGAAVTLLALADHAVGARNGGLTRARLTALGITAVEALVACALIALTTLHGVHNLRWWTFGLASGMVGTSLLASTIHELTSERVRHELEVAQGSTASELATAQAG